MVDLSVKIGDITLQNPVLGQCVEGLKQYVTVKGGAYFFLPGIMALKYLESLSNPQPTPSPSWPSAATPAP